MQTTSVGGVQFEIHQDFIRRATFAVNTQTKERKRIKSNGYIHCDLTVRKAIALVFGFESFRM